MSDLSPAALSARPRPGRVFDRDVVYHPLRVVDLMDWDVWAQGQYRRAARLGMNDGTDEEKLRYRIESDEESKRICFGSSYAWVIECSFPGLLYLAWLSLRHGIPGLTLDVTAEIFGFGTRLPGEQTDELRKARLEIHVASGFVPESVLLGIAKKNKPESGTNSLTQTGGGESSDTSGSTTDAGRNG